MASRILVVEDDEDIGSGLTDALRAVGYEAIWTKTAAAALDSAVTAHPDVVLLDLGLPDSDGVDLCRRLRLADPHAAIIMVTARRDEIDAVVGLDAGADDYVTKPFRLVELLARIRAQVRRVDASEKTDHFTVGDLEIDVGARRAWHYHAALDLRTKEFELLVLLASKAGRVVTRERIMSEVWDEHWFGSTKTLDMHISSLRRKLGDDGQHPKVITTVRGVGYRLELPPRP
jgi:DNA-binding response OmpR family regulator